MPKATDEEKKAAEEKKREAELAKQKEEAALGDYHKRLEKVREFKAMTDTTAWQSYYSGLLNRIEKHGQMVLDAEQTRDVVRHQEGVKIIRSILEEVEQVVKDLNSYVNAQPLFAPLMHTRAEWNAALCKIELR